ncbi:MAG: SufD family Fe-S cluster assembly protein [Ruminococcaceae bacterium]|nr:SufD family Fe-S cluster assembly protein [Oscillospiraceae bacterium]
MEKLDFDLLKEIALMDSIPTGAYNIRKNGGSAGRFSTESIRIETKTDKPGIDINIKSGTKGETVHIPVIITDTGYTETVYNDFFIGDDCDVTIMAGCGIHNCGDSESRHDGVHTFYIGKNSIVRYSERHYGDGDGSGERIMNPETIVYVGEGSTIQMDTTQIRGIDSTARKTKIVVGKDGSAIINEKLLTHGKQYAESDMDLVLEGENANGRIISRSVGQDDSKQVFRPCVTGKAQCFGHIRCDSILMGKATISSIPAVAAEHPEANLIHEAAIGRIAGDQLIKLMTLGLTEEEAEEKILEGFLGEESN